MAATSAASPGSAASGSTTWSGPASLFCTAEPLDPQGAAAAWWHEHGVVLDASAHPELRPLLHGEPACAIRPDRYVLTRGGVDEVTVFAQAVLNRCDRIRTRGHQAVAPSPDPADR